MATPLELEFELAKDGTLSICFELPATGQRTSLPIERTTGTSPEQCEEWKNWLDTGQLVGRFD